ncbi:MAG: hypothetical protein ACLFVQ_05870 [Chitinispirillaceae bacterium]
MITFILYRLSRKALRAVFVQVLLWAALLSPLHARDGNDTTRCELPVMKWTRYRPEVIAGSKQKYRLVFPGSGYVPYKAVIDSALDFTFCKLKGKLLNFYTLEGIEDTSDIMRVIGACSYVNGKDTNFWYHPPGLNGDSVIFNVCGEFDKVKGYVHIVGNNPKELSEAIPYDNLIQSDPTAHHDYHLGEIVEDTDGIWFASFTKYKIDFTDKIIKGRPTPFQQREIDAVISEKLQKVREELIDGEIISRGLNILSIPAEKRELIWEEKLKDWGISFGEGTIGVFPLGTFGGVTRILVNYHFWKGIPASMTLVFDFSIDECRYVEYHQSGDFGAPWFISAYAVGKNKLPEIFVVTTPEREGHMNTILVPLSDKEWGRSEQSYPTFVSEDDY